MARHYIGKPLTPEQMRRLRDINRGFVQELRDLQGTAQQPAGKAAPASAPPVSASKGKQRRQMMDRMRDRQSKERATADKDLGLDD